MESNPIMAHHIADGLTHAVPRLNSNDLAQHRIEGTIDLTLLFQTNERYDIESRSTDCGKNGTRGSVTIG
ncbi:MAG: hypothetical protein J7M25_10990 [Deltaproteobacteria bacterium]|nr:hypothetical protein [Deltaproteobacteria bacterium]